MGAKGEAKRRALQQHPVSSAPNDSGRTKALDSEGPSRRFERMPSQIISISDNAAISGKSQPYLSSVRCSEPVVRRRLDEQAVSSGPNRPGG